MTAENRIGTFDIPDDAFEENSDVVRKIMGCCMIVRAEHLLQIKGVRYVAFCPDFEECDEAVDPPTYDIEVSDEGVVSWVKRG
jgi:hypothetical protein